MDDYTARRPGRPSGITTEPLWREVLGARLRRLRKHRKLTLTQLARRAGVSPQYLSEVERGRKEPSSEMIAAISGALGISLLELTVQVTDELHRTARTTIELARSAAGPAVALFDDELDAELSLPSLASVSPDGTASWHRTTEQLSLVA
ncbi:MAG TPA: helix-turn-helix domain-containing protein [Enteractinococcus helveticum]|uniref:Helix-turn-helix domain-containing protein n=1 Tax=Enteractinococcus helveticum TaxID=1837282 RepID=A0A921FN43_9MICC|nr:helix-turn-helix domain-containing protein [Enteractinococcus helveticum]HJF14890.1 helix-turn-helix domain-containing protein [Enteractinococcus helveticum]